MGDYTRWTFDPAKDYKSVFKQQGRVDLDADWNEFVEITDRRWRSETIDLGGQDFVAASTPDAFLITPAGPNGFTIGIGRMYVDGLVAENHGLPPTQFDPVLGEMQQTNPVPYSNQPYYPSPLPPGVGVPNTTDLIYLDVWEREVTAIQDPNIREKALAGPDTCTRLQTVWQVKDLPNVGLHGCQDDIQAWDHLIAPSPGRLTTSTVPPNPGATPCILSQTGGYTGLENRLYRVEVHVAGTVDGANPAQFKWSRDDGSVVAAVTGISASGANSLLNVTTLGRDSVLRFNAGDWVEILDDYTEFQSSAGWLTKIVSPPDASNLTLTVHPPVPASFSPSDPTRHTRVRRWDQRADLNANVNAVTGLIAVSAGPVDIEKGIQVSFSTDPANGSLNVGDYWIFAARTFDASVEPLVNAPPRGILHHYCRLGYMTWAAAGGGSGTFADCRPTPQKCECGGECSATVGDGVDSVGQFTDIQKAIDSLGPAGGVVCVGRGVYVVNNTINIDPSKGKVTLRGMGSATRIIFQGGEGGASVLFNIVQTDHIVIDGFFMATIRASALIQFVACSFSAVRDCTLVNLDIEAATGISLANTVAASAAGSSARAIAMTGPCTGCSLERNAFIAAKGVVAASPANLKVRDNDFLTFHGAVFFTTGNGVDIEYNLMRGLSTGVFQQLQGLTGGNLSRANINAFQSKVTSVLAAPQGNAFMGTGVFFISGFDIDISHNRIAAQAAVVSFLIIDASFDANEILAFVGFFSLFAVMVRVTNSVIAGLLLGYLQFGIVIDLACESNVWLGFFGITLLPLADFLTQAGPAVANGLQRSNIVADGSKVLSSAQSLGETVGTLSTFGIAANVKIRGNDFFTFLFGVAKFERFLSADFSIVDNSFSACINTGIYLATQMGEIIHKGFVPFNPRHLIQANSFFISGTGIKSQCSSTFIRDNSISCSTVGIDLLGPNCDVSNNDISGDPVKNSPSSGLIQVGADAVHIRGNRLSSGSGSGIVMMSDVSDLVIEDNGIQNMGQNGVTSVDALSNVTGASISRNNIQSCAGRQQFWHGGAIVLADAVDIRINGNTIVNNVTAGPPPGDAHAVYIDSINGADIAENFIANNCTVPSTGQRPTMGAVAAGTVAGEVLFHGNRVRGNGGTAVYFQGRDPAGSISVQQNYVDNTANASANPDAYLVYGDTSGLVHLENNLCFFTAGANSAFASAASVSANLAVVNANTLQTNPSTLYALVLHGLSSTATAIITSNMVSGLFSTDETSFVKANNVGI